MTTLPYLNEISIAVLVVAAVVAAAGIGWITARKAERAEITSV